MLVIQAWPAQAQLGPDAPMSAWIVDDLCQRYEVQQLVQQDRLQELSERVLTAIAERPARCSLEHADHTAVWAPLRRALAHGQVDQEPWYELLTAVEIAVRRGDLDRPSPGYDLRDWLFVVDLLGVWERFAPALLHARERGVALPLDQQLRVALLRHATPEQAGALVTRFTSVVHAALLDTERGPRSSVSSLSSGSLDVDRRVVAEDYLDLVAAAYHAAIVSGQREQAGWVLRDAHAAVQVRAVSRLPDLGRRLRTVDAALREAGLEPLPWDAPAGG